MPIGVVAIILAVLFLPQHAAEDPSTRIDVTGVALLTAGSALLIVPLVQGRERGWPWWTYVMFAASLAAFALFVRSEHRSTHPVLTPSLFRKRSFIVGLGITAAFFASQTGFTLAFNLLLQLGFGWTALHTGLTLIPWALGSAVGTVLSGAILAARLGRRTLHLGLALAVIGMLGLFVTIAAVGSDLDSFVVAPALLVGGLGAGMVFIPLFDYILGDATADEVGTGSGLLNAVQQFASAIGAAALGTVFFAQAAGAQHGYTAAAELVIVIVAIAFAITFLLIGLLPKHLRQQGPPVEDTDPATLG